MRRLLVGFSLLGLVGCAGVDPTPCDNIFDPRERNACYDAYGVGN
jgi:hypothetical protein